LTIFRDVDHLRSRAIRDALEVIRAARFLVERDAGLMRGLELDLVADGSGEGDACGEEQAEDHQK
jgi:hypothetical protein